MSDLAERLDDLGLRATGAGLDDLIALATKERWSPVQLLERVVDLDEKDRVRRSLERRFSDSHLGRFKPMIDYDWAWPTKIDRELVEHSLGGGYLAAARNIVLAAPQGLGKTMIAQNLAHQAVLMGHSVLFVTAAQLLLDLGSQESSRALDRRLKHYAKISLLVLDEVGYLAFDNRNADLLFQVVSRRYEKKSLVLTTNLAFSDWPTVFPNATCATALIDRVIHHADVIAIEGESYRLREAKEHAGRRAPSPRDDGVPKNKKK
ncbi:IS21-like element helper ATPase IstB [Sorangium sp. So ce362]|uniref:IS21-like element helper ATPase IstB n=1 Tax=Sorangium sp. So ce362 TaxID=3133303 RepID=UPI003F6225E3